MWGSPLNTACLSKLISPVTSHFLHSDVLLATSHSALLLMSATLALTKEQQNSQNSFPQDYSSCSCHSLLYRKSLWERKPLQQSCFWPRDSLLDCLTFWGVLCVFFSLSQSADSLLPGARDLKCKQQLKKLSTLNSTGSLLIAPCRSIAVCCS